MQARARRTREKILAQAKRAFAERGFEATNLTEHILTPAGVSVGSFYHQFTNKREVLLEIFSTAIAARHDRLRVHLRSMAMPDFEAAYRSVLSVLVDEAMADPEIWSIQWREHESPDAEIRTRAMIGTSGWTDVMVTIMEPYYPDGAARARAAEMSVLLGSGMLRDFCHLDPDVQASRRDGLIDTCARFARAGVDAVIAAG